MDPNIIGLFSVCMTTAGAIIVAIINTRQHALKAAEENKKQILDAIADLKNDLNDNSRATVATTRGLISNAYWQYQSEKAMPEQVKRNIIDLYEAYKGITVDGHTPNSWCDEIVNEMKTWKTK